MAHWRTARSVVGGVDQPSGPHTAQDTPRDSSISFDEPGLLFFAMVIAPLLFVGLIVLCHRALI